MACDPGDLRLPAFWRSPNREDRHRRNSDRAATDLDQKPETASRVCGRVEAVLDYAKTREWRSGESPARWRGHLDDLLPARAKVRQVEHHAALPWQQISTFMTDLRQQKGIAAHALEFTILTAARTGEVLGARWGEVDIQAALWTVPARG